MPVGPWPTDGAEMPAEHPSTCQGANPEDRSPSMSATGAAPGPSASSAARSARHSCAGSVWGERARAATNRSRSRISSVRTSPSRPKKDRADSDAFDRRPARGHHRFADAEATGLVPCHWRNGGPFGLAGDTTGHRFKRLGLPAVKRLRAELVRRVLTHRPRMSHCTAWPPQVAIGYSARCSCHRGRGSRRP